jgi:hypothetical protein
MMGPLVVGESQPLHFTGSVIALCSDRSPCLPLTDSKAVHEVLLTKP